MYFTLMLRIILYIFSQEIYDDNGRIYQIKIYKNMLTSNYDCVSATDKFTGIDTVFASLVMLFIYVSNPTTSSIITQQEILRVNHVWNTWKATCKTRIKTRVDHVKKVNSQSRKKHVNKTCVISHVKSRRNHVYYFTCKNHRFHTYN